MKLYESNVTDSLEEEDDEWHSFSYIESSYVVSVSVWMLIVLLIVLVPESWIAFLGNVLLRCWKSIWNILNRKIYRKGSTPIKTHAIEQYPTVPSINTMEKSLVPVKKIKQIVATTHKSQSTQELKSTMRNKRYEYYIAFKYLCTCIAANRILARKPIRPR